jgi:hypothetical protein
MPSAEMSGSVATEEHPTEKDTSPRRPERDMEDDGGEASENEKENEKKQEKGEDKDSKAWQQDGDFAYEYVQLAQVRYASRLHFTFQSLLLTPLECFPGTFASIVLLPMMNADVIAT